MSPRLAATALRRALGGALGFSALAACASSGASGGAPATRTPAVAAPAAAAAPAPAATAAPARRPARGSANVIVEAELAASGAQNALEAIKLLRPTMLIARGGITSEQPGGIEIVIYVDGTRAGNRDALTAIPVSRVREVRFLNAADATTRFGTGHNLGAILVTTKRQ